ncbi:3-oxoacyl-[acyl-carrier-protein] reductase [Entamoeba marina]
MKETKRLAVVTGGTSGIGEEIVRQLHKDKWNVIFVGRREDLGKKISMELSNDDANVDFYKLDVTDFKEYPTFVNYVTDKYNQLDLLVNNAGKVMYETCDSLKESEFDELYQTNVKSVWLMTKSFHELLDKSHGSVVNIGSDVSIKANPDYFGYSDTKAAVVHITKMMALQYAPNVRVNAVCPGDTFVERWVCDEQLERRFGKELAEDKEMKTQLIESMHHSIDIPLKRVGEVEDIAKAVLFLGGKDSSYITGVALLVDGGASLV